MAVDVPILITFQTTNVVAINNMLPVYRKRKAKRVAIFWMKIVVMLFLPASAIFSQPVFYSQSLQKLYYSLPSNCRLYHPVADTVIQCNGILQGITVPVAYSVDSYGMLANIGYRFLPGESDTLLRSPVIRFLEREALALLVADNLEQKLISNRENGLTLLHNGNTPRQDFYRSRNGLPDALQQVSGLHIRYEDEIKYRVTLNYGQGQTLTFLFVADAELMSNMDKKERDNRLSAQLIHHRAKTGNIPKLASACSNASIQIFSDTLNVLYYCPGKAYMISQINSNLFYLKNGNSYELAFTRLWSVASFQNAMLASAGHNYTVRITHRKYGGEIQRYEIKSNDFFDYFSDGYDRYFGIEKSERDVLSGTLIISDRSAGSIHLAYVSVHLSDLLNGGIMEMKLESNIPQHNIETLFGNMKDRNNDNEEYKMFMK